MSTSLEELLSRINRIADGLTGTEHRGSLELFVDEIAPVLRQEIPSRPFPKAQVPLVPAPAVPVPGLVPSLS